jgi:hypothetical protein
LGDFGDFGFNRGFGDLGFGDRFAGLPRRTGLGYGRKWGGSADGDLGFGDLASRYDRLCPFSIPIGIEYKTSMFV